MLCVCVYILKCVINNNQYQYDELLLLTIKMSDSNNVFENVEVTEIIFDTAFI